MTKNIKNILTIIINIFLINIIIFRLPDGSGKPARGRGRGRVGSGRVRPWHDPEPARVGEERSEPDPTRPVRKPTAIYLKPAIKL